MKKTYLVISSVLIAVAALVTVNITNTESLAANGPRDCNNNSIVNCGALSQGELLAKFDQNATGDLPQVYGHYGLSRSDMAGQTSEVKMGRAFKDGRIEVDGVVVATNASSVGRGNAAGSHPVNINGRTYYESPNSTIFRTESIETYVIMRGGQFHSAVLTSCANPMKATPTPPPAPKPTPPPAPTPTPPAPKPEFSCDELKANKISRTEYGFTTKATATNGATITGYTYDFGDGTNKTSATPDVQHNYEKAGNYNVKVSVQVGVAGTTKNAEGPKCQTSVVVKEQPPAPEKCEIPGYEHLPKDSPECVVVPPAPTAPTPPQTPVELPRTGLESFISGGFGIGSLTAAAYYWVDSRRNLASKLLNR